MLSLSCIRSTADSLFCVQVEAKCWSQEVAKLGDAAQSYTRSDGEVVRLMLAKPVQLDPKGWYMLSALIKVSLVLCS